MPIIAAALESKLKQKMADSFKVASKLPPEEWGGPMSGPAAPHFSKFCKAIAGGIATASTSMTFQTVDAGVGGMPPVPGTGVGKGLIVDVEFFTERIYTKLRNASLAQYGKTSHDPYPPHTGNSGEFLLGLAKSISESIAEHFSDAIVLNSNHAGVYIGSGKILTCSGVPASKTASEIQSAGSMPGSFFKTFCLALGEAYEETLAVKTTGKVVIMGVCAPGPTQLCGLPKSGSGVGTIA